MSDPKSESFKGNLFEILAEIFFKSKPMIEKAIANGGIKFEMKIEDTNADRIKELESENDCLKNTVDWRKPIVELAMRDGWLCSKCVHGAYESSKEPCMYCGGGVAFEEKR